MAVTFVDWMLVLLSVSFICRYVYYIFVKKAARLSIEGAGLLCLLGAVLVELLPVYLGRRESGTDIPIRIGLLLYLCCFGIQRLTLKEKMFPEKWSRYLIRQLNLHFIFNTLGAIRIVTKTNSDLAYDMLYDFSKCLRAVLRPFFCRDRILFKEEVAHIISYTNLEKIRFGNDIIVRMEIAEENFLLPPLSVQPLVENAIRHGLNKGRRKGVVTVRSYQTDTEYIIQVEDDGTGFDVSRYRRPFLYNRMENGGLERVRCRIEHMAGGSMDIRSFEGIGTVITLHIPKRKSRKGVGNYEDENDSG